MTIAIIFAGGVGARMGASIPKQFLVMNGKPVLAHTLELFQKHPEIDKIRIVATKDCFGRVREIVDTYGISKCVAINEGGATAQDSIYNGLKATAAEEPSDAIVLLHDGVRPYIMPEVISANIKSVREKGNAVTFTPCYETLVISEDGTHISDIPPRRMSYSAQAPQSFRLGEILAAHEKIRATPEGYTDLVDQATLCWKLGIPINLVPGNRGNIKITTPEDIVTLEALLKSKMKRVLVTGATGLVGRAVARELVKRGYRVVALVRDLNKAASLLPREVELVQGDVMEKPVIEGKIDAIIHAACPTASKFFVEHPEETRQTIVEGTRQMLDLAKEKCARLVYISSMEVFGASEKEDVAEDDLGYLDPNLPRNSYPLGKREAEALCCAYAQAGGDVVVARPVQTFGVGVQKTDNRVFMQFLRAKLSGEDIVLKTTGTKAHCYCETSDCIDGILTILEKGVSGEVYNISNEETFCTIREMAEMLVGTDRVRIELDPSAYPPSTRMRIKSDKLRALGWVPRYNLKEMYERLEAEL